MSADIVPSHKSTADWAWRLFAHHKLLEMRAHSFSLYQMLPLNHIRTTSSLVPPIFYKTKNLQESSLAPPIFNKIKKLERMVYH